MNSKHSSRAGTRGRFDAFSIAQDKSNFVKPTIVPSILNKAVLSEGPLWTITRHNENPVETEHETVCDVL